jgi:hypothetical protein
MSGAFGYIGIDFGTSNSHFSFCNDADRPSPDAVAVGKGGSMPTCVLWRQPGEAEEDILAYGEHAQSQWIGMDDDERKGVRFAFGFKPDLVQSARARRDAWGFLHAAAGDLKQAGLARPLGPGGYAVVIGVPAEIGSEHKAVTARLAAEAGLGQVECVEEPLGALAYHLSKGDLTSQEARRGVLVVDFGGGTFDVALANTRGLEEPWGDPALGGRLFDDLFLQWVLDQNPGLEVAPEEALVVWQNECRRVKEDFSNTWATALKQGKPFPDDFKRPIEVGDRKVWLKRPTVEEFQQRAGRYVPSHVVRRYLRGLDKPVGGLVIEQPTDLFARIRQVLGRGLQGGGVANRFARVILTGGSCWWPFMKALVGEVLGVPADRVMMSQNPEATIGSGLALYHVLKGGNEQRRREIEGHVPAAVAAFETATAARLDRYADDVAAAMVGRLLPRIEERYWDWYHNGGSLNAVEARVSDICAGFEKAEAEGVLKPHWESLNADLIRHMREHLTRFLRANEIPTAATEYIPESVKSVADLQAGREGAKGRIVGGVGDMAAVVTVITTIALLILGAVKVKVIGAVVIASLHNPPLAVALGVAALVAAVAAGNAVRQVLENAIKNHEFNKVTGWMLRRVLWESSFRKKLEESRAEALEKVREAVRDSTRRVPDQFAHDPDAVALEPAALAKFKAIVEGVASDLGVLDQIRTPAAAR